MAWDGFYVTNRGKNLIAKVVASQTNIPFTNFKVGDGTITSQSPANMTAMINPLYTFPVSRLIQKTNIATIGFQFDNQQVTSGFYWREIGLYATDPDLGEILFAYTNSGQGAEYVDAGGSNNVLTQLFDFNLTISDTINITAQLDQTIVYASKQELDDAFQDAKEYTDERFNSIVIPDASTTQKGIVQLTNNNTGTSQTLAPTQKALGDHVNNAVAHMTQAQKDTLANALPKTGGVVTGQIEFTGALPIRFNVPGQHSWFIHESGGGAIYISPSKSNNGTDYDFGKGIQIQEDNIIWSGGDLNSIKQSGVDRKNELVSAINANGGSASASEDMSALIVKLANIAKTRYKEGSATRNSYVNNADFIVFPSGYVSKITAGYFPSFADNPSILNITVNNGGSFVVTGIDADGRAGNVISLSNPRGYALLGLAAAPGVIYAAVKDLSSSSSVTWTALNISGFRIDAGVRWRVGTSGNVTTAAPTAGNVPIYGG